MATGQYNPLPFRTGGAPTPTQRIYAALVSVAGKGNAGPAGGLRELWRLCQARAIARAGDAKQLAALQAYPPTMTVHLPAMERYFALPASADDVTARAAVWAAWTRSPDATGPNLGAELRAIDPAFALDSIPWSASSTMIPGKTFGPLPGDTGPAFGTGQAAGRYSAEWGHASDAYILRVRYYLAPGQTEIPVDVLARAEKVLADLTPFHMTREIYNLTAGTDGEGLYADGGDDGSSLLDQTGL